MEEFYGPEVETATSGVDELGASIGQGLGQIAAMLAAVDSVRTGMAAARDELAGQLEQLDQAMAQSEQLIETQVALVAEGFQALESRIAGFDNETSSALDAMRNQFGDLEGRANEMLSTARSHYDSCKQGLEQLSQQIVDYQSAAAAEVQSRQEQIQQFQGQIEAVESELTQRKDALVSDYDQLTSQLVSSASSMHSDFAGLMSSIGSNLTSASSLVDSTNAEKLDFLRNLFLDQMLAQLGENASQLTDAMSLLEATGQAGQELLDSGLGDLLDSMKGVIDVLEQVKPVLDAVQSMLR
jgi:DNA repair exonuclease SbcCD ATPase subunit